jgi:CRISPR-associated protein Cmr3
MNWNTYLFDPLSPLVLRTGRPFDNQAGDPVSLDFPLPTTVAGAFRTTFGDYKNWIFSEKTNDLKRISVHGPLAVAIDGEELTPLFPKPADAVYLRNAQQKTEVCHLQPERLKDGEITDLPHHNLNPVFLQKKGKFKPDCGSTWWSSEVFLKWLAEPSSMKTATALLGWSGPERELRTHVAIDGKTFGAEKSRLFQTEGMDFGSCRRDGVCYGGWHNRRYGLVANVGRENMDEIPTDFCRLGGEGRMCAIKSVAKAWPVLQGELKKKIVAAKTVRLILATPALFANGWKPGWLDGNLTGTPPGFPDIKLTLRSVVCPRWQPISGWDFKTRKTRAVRRMVPAGSVYWFDVVEGEEKLPDLWLQPINDAEQDGRDGFGLVTIGIWEK